VLGLIPTRTLPAALQAEIGHRHDH
jgi:hypothetical protein